MATRNTNIKLKTYNQTIITQLGTCIIQMEHNNKQKICNFFVVPRNRQALLGMPNIEILNIININCNATGTKETDTAITQGTGNDHHYTNTMQEAGGWKGAIQTQTVIQI